jgi:hypothetical protein
MVSVIGASAPEPPVADDPLIKSTENASANSSIIAFAVNALICQRRLARKNAIIAGMPVVSRPFRWTLTALKCGSRA